MPRIRLLASLSTLALVSSLGLAVDWPQFRGPNRDGVSTEKGLLQSWPPEGPPLAWSTKGLGGGYSTVSVAKDRIYTLGNQQDKEKKRGRLSYLVALNRADGKVLWTAEVGPAGGSLGCTPTVDGDRIYALGQMGDLVCIDKDGNRVWHRDLVKDFGGQKGGWNYCESPLVDGDRLIVTPGGTEATIVALNKATGETVWKCPIPSRSPQAGYSSVVIANAGGVKQYIQLYNGGVVGVGTDGKLLWHNKTLASNTANVPNPIVTGEYVFASAGYGKGAVLLRLKAEGKGVTAEQVYHSRELGNRHGGVVKVGDYVYGDTDQEGRPFCGDFMTGKRLWHREDGSGGANSAAVTYADGRLYIHYQNGVVALVKASPEKYEEFGSFSPPKLNGAAWAHPVVCDGHLYLREGDYLYCYDVRAKM